VSQNVTAPIVKELALTLEQCILTCLARENQVLESGLLSGKLNLEMIQQTAFTRLVAVRC
jgi:hypothetical protein